ncbi:uncharacterized protein LOC110863313 [Folsomia candida]|nr:uncharacterized protein LOC110863313 [Folsomia candida]
MSSQYFFLFMAVTFSIIATTTAWRSTELKQSDPYGKPCVNGTVPEGSKLVNCDRETKSLVCSSTGKCECAASDKKTMYDPGMRSCFLVPYEEDDFRCTTDYQCYVSSYGKWSRCSLEQGKCECFAEGATTELKYNVCYTLKKSSSIMEYPSCQNNAECYASNLGNLTRCNMANLFCECYDTLTNGKNEVGYHAGRCVYSRRLGDFCESDAECRVVHGGAYCGEHTSYLQKEKTCQCPDGNLNKCDSGTGGGSGFKAAERIWVVALTTIVLGVTATRVVG